MLTALGERATHEVSKQEEAEKCQYPSQRDAKARSEYSAEEDDREGQDQESEHGSSGVCLTAKVQGRRALTEAEDS